MPNYKVYFNAHRELIHKIIEDKTLQVQISETIDSLVFAYRNGHKVLFCGNGGSAADAEHLAGELSGRFKLDRAALNAEALHVNSATLTAIANDYGYGNAYARILSAKAVKGDILFAMTTSGTSENVLKALGKANEIGVKTILLSGSGPINGDMDIHLSIPSTDTPRIQEAMMLLGHIICEEVEKKLFS